MSQFVNHRKYNLEIKDHALFFNNTKLFFCHTKWIYSFSSLLFPFPLPIFFFLLTVGYLSLGGGTSCPRPACRCIPLITGCWDLVVQPACGTSRDAPKGHDASCYHAHCSSAQKGLPRLCKNCIHDASMFWWTAMWSHSWGSCAIAFSLKASFVLEYFAAKGPKHAKD